MSLVDLCRVVSKGVRVGSGEGGRGQVRHMMNKWLEGCLSKLQLLLCLLLLCLLARPLAVGPLLLRTLVLGTATTSLLPRRHRGGLPLLLELGILQHFVLDRADLVDLLAFLLFPFASQGSSSPCHIDSSMDFSKSGLFRFPRRVFSLHNDLCNGIKGGKNLCKETEHLDVIRNGVGRILHPCKQAFKPLNGWFRVPQVGE